MDFLHLFTEEKKVSKIYICLLAWKILQGFWQSPWKMLLELFRHCFWMRALLASFATESDCSGYLRRLFIWIPLLSFHFQVLDSNHFCRVLYLKERIALLMMQWLLNDQPPEQARPLQFVPQTHLHEWGRFHSAPPRRSVATQVCCRIALLGTRSGLPHWGL